MKKYIGIVCFEHLIELEHGKIGSESRMEYEKNAHMFIVSEMLKEARKEANLTQNNLQKKLEQKKVTSQKLKMEKEISICLR
jgi:DNA-binding XRE family transcriptional regulator